MIVTGGILWALLCGWSLFTITTPNTVGIRIVGALVWLAYGEGFVGVLALELWSRVVLHQRLEGRPSLEAKLVWRLALALSLVAVWVWVGYRIWGLGVRYYAEDYGGIPPATDYDIKVVFTIGAGVLISVLICSLLGLARNVIEQVRAGRGE